MLFKECLYFVCSFIVGEKVSSTGYAIAFSVYYNFSEHCITTWHSMINCRTYIALFCIKCKINKSFIIFSWKILKPWFAHVIIRNRLFVLQATLKMDAITKYSFPYLSFVKDAHGEIGMEMVALWRSNLSYMTSVMHSKDDMNVICNGKS